jgi:hypothetical protein
MAGLLRLQTGLVVAMQHVVLAYDGAAKNSKHN